MSATKSTKRNDAQRPDPGFARARAVRKDEQRPDPGFARAKALADRGLISSAEMKKFQDKTWRKGKNS